MRLLYNFSTSMSRHEPDDYVRNMEVTVECYDEDCSNAYILGKLAMDQILWADAVFDDASLFEICDNDSQGFHEAHVILSKGANGIRKDLKVSDDFTHVMFIYGAVFHPAIHPFRQGIIDSAVNLFGRNSLAVMWKETSGLSEAELADMGFRKIAGAELIYRHNALSNAFSEGHPRGQDADLIALPEHQEWVLEAWKEFAHMIDR